MRVFNEGEPLSEMQRAVHHPYIFYSQRVLNGSPMTPLCLPIHLPKPEEMRVCCHSYQ